MFIENKYYPDNVPNVFLEGERPDLKVGEPFKRGILTNVDIDWMIINGQNTKGTVVTYCRSGLADHCKKCVYLSTCEAATKP